MLGSSVVRACFLDLAAAATVRAEGVTEIIRGRVMNDSAKVVVGASVFVTRGPDRAFKQTTTDSAGRYSVSFENGTGDYLVAVSSVGLKPSCQARCHLPSRTVEASSRALGAACGTPLRLAAGLYGRRYAP
jgi:hypothetical protein